MPLQRLLLLALAPFAAACGDDGPGVRPDAPVPDASPDAPVMVMQMVDRTGGTIALPGGAATVTIPPDAIDRPTMITLEVAAETPPPGAMGPLYKLGPNGHVFAHPVTVTLALPTGATSGDVYWSNANGAPGYTNIGGTVDAGKVTAQIVHFSEGYVAPAMTTRTVTGSQMVAWVSASSFELRATDLTTFAVAALVEDGSGGYTTIAGVGHADGTFEIDGVPDGAYWLRVPDAVTGVAYYRTSASAVDAGYTAQGRPDAVALTTPTNLVLDVTNLAAWQAGDQIEMFSSESFNWYFETQKFATAGLPAVDATELAGYTFDLAASYAGTPHVIDGAHVPPDRLVVAQLARRTTTSGVSYQAMSRLFEPEPFTVIPGQVTTLTGTFTNVATGQTLALDVRADAIRASLAEEARPCTVPIDWPYGWNVYVLGVAGGLEHGITGNTADFLLLDLATTTPDVAGTDFTYGVPLTGTWGVYADARFTRPCEITPPGATSPAVIEGAYGLHVNEPIATLAGGPLGVRLSQVRTPTIAGASLFQPGTGTGITPVLAWTAPSTGTPSHYSVEVIRVFADGSGAGQSERVAHLVTDQTSMTLPAGILTAGQHYVFAIGAHTSSRPDPSAFNREVLPEYAAHVLSAIQSP